MMRLDKFLAHAGLGTRKEVKELVRKGRVEINGQRVKKDDLKIDEQTDQVCVDGEIIAYESAVYIMLNKPQEWSVRLRTRYSNGTGCLESSRKFGPGG